MRESGVRDSAVDKEMAVMSEVAARIPQSGGSSHSAERRERGVSDAAGRTMVGEGETGIDRVYIVGKEN